MHKLWHARKALSLGIRLRHLKDQLRIVKSLAHQPVQAKGYLVCLDMRVQEVTSVTHSVPSINVNKLSVNQEKLGNKNNRKCLSCVCIQKVGSVQAVMHNSWMVFEIWCSFVCLLQSLRILLCRRWWDVRFHFRRQPCLKIAWCCFVAAKGETCTRNEKCLKIKKKSGLIWKKYIYKKRFFFVVITSALLFLHTTYNGLMVFLWLCRQVHLFLSMTFFCAFLNQKQNQSTGIQTFVFVAQIIEQQDHFFCAIFNIYWWLQYSLGLILIFYPSCNFNNIAYTSKFLKTNLVCQ